MNALRVISLSLVVLAIFALTVVVVAFLVALLQGTSLTDPWSINLGILCGLIVWLFVAIFHIRAETIYLPVRRRGGFLDSIQQHLEELGYHVEKAEKTRLVARPGFHSYLMGGGIAVELEEAAARVSGPKLSLEMLRKRVRMDTVVGKAQQAIRESQRRQGEKLLKRVAITLRVPLECWDELYTELIEVLVKENVRSSAS
jgi:hypothetical protein